MGVYFTFESRTCVEEAVLEVLKKGWLKDFANPMSAYQFGSRAKYMMDLSRDCIGKFLKVDRDEIFFVASLDEALVWIDLILKENDLDWHYSRLTKDTSQVTTCAVINIEGGLSYLPLKERIENVIYYGSFREVGGPIDGYFVSIPAHLRGVALIHGGHQERARRAGTQNLPAISAMEKALVLFQRNRQVWENRWEINRKKILDFIPPTIDLKEKELAYIDLNFREGKRAVLEDKLLQEDIICDFEGNSVRLWIPYELKDEDLSYVEKIIRIVEEFYE